MSTTYAMEGAKATRNVLITLCSDTTVQGCVDNSPGHGSYRVIQCIVLRNVLSGRVTRQYNCQHASDLHTWFRSYIRNVDSHFVKEHTRWLHLQSPGGQLELYELLTQLAYQHHADGHIYWLEIDKLDIAHEAYIRSGERLRRYPFDLPLNMWLDRHIRQCADRLHRDLYTSSATRGAVEYLPDINPSADCKQWDVLIDLERSIQRLSVENLAVLRLWLQGFSLEETSHQLDLTEKAVSNRRWRIQKRLSMP